VHPLLEILVQFTLEQVWQRQEEVDLCMSQLVLVTVEAVVSWSFQLDHPLRVLVVSSLWRLALVRLQADHYYSVLQIRVQQE